MTREEIFEKAKQLYQETDPNSDMLKYYYFKSIDNKEELKKVYLNYRNLYELDNKIRMQVKSKVLELDIERNNLDDETVKVLKDIVSLAELGYFLEKTEEIKF